MKKKLIFAFLLLLILTSCVNSKEKQISKQFEEEIKKIDMSEEALEEETGSKEEKESVPEEKKKKVTVTFNIVGDIGFGSQFGQPYQFEYKFREMGSKYFSDGFREIFQSADFNQANLENVFTDSKDYQIGKIYTYKAHSKDYIQILKDAKIDYVNVVNNHMQDFKEQGFNDTLKLLDEKGIKYFGTNLMPTNDPELGSIMTDNYAIFEKDGLKIGMLGFFGFYDTYPTDEVIKERTDMLRNEGVDFIVAHMHAGGQETNTVTERQIYIAHKLIDNGVDLVAGSHPHALQKTEIYKGKKIYYSLGNFLFIAYNSSSFPETIVLNVEVTKDGDNIDVKYKNIPYLFTGAYGTNLYRPCRVEDENVKKKIENIIGEACE